MRIDILRQYIYCITSINGLNIEIINWILN